MIVICQSRDTARISTVLRHQNEIFKLVNPRHLAGGEWDRVRSEVGLFSGSVVNVYVQLLLNNSLILATAKRRLNYATD